MRMCKACPALFTLIWYILLSDKDLASFPDLSRFYVRLIHAKLEREEIIEKQEAGTISHVR